VTLYLILFVLGGLIGFALAALLRSAREDA